MASGNKSPAEKESLPLTALNPNNEALEAERTLDLGCSHYRRNCKLISPCCKKKYTCRYCHNEKENHELIRKNVERIECLACSTEQPVSQYCISKECQIIFGKYFCSICNLFDNCDRQQYHCDGCGLCRVGGRSNFYHCDRCEMCLPKKLETSHQCIAEISRRDCPICLEDIHTSRIMSNMPPCGHLIHRTCFKDLLNAGLYACPICGQSLVQMNEIWKTLDAEIATTPMPAGLANAVCQVLCKDCHQESSTVYHTLGLKCVKCGSYNTSRGNCSLQTTQD